MSYREWVELGLAVVFVAMCFYDLVAWLVGGHDATLTAVIRDWSHRYPVLVLLVGMLLGHLFWT